MRLRQRIGTIGYVCYLAASLLRWNFQFYSGRTLMTFGLRVRPWLPDEFAHAAFLRTLRWTYWQPAWVDRTHQRNTDQ